MTIISTYLLSFSSSTCFWPRRSGVRRSTIVPWTSNSPADMGPRHWGFNYSRGKSSATCLTHENYCNSVLLTCSRFTPIRRTTLLFFIKPLWDGTWSSVGTLPYHAGGWLVWVVCPEVDCANKPPSAPLLKTDCAAWLHRTESCRDEWPNRSCYNWWRACLLLHADEIFFMSIFCAGFVQIVTYSGLLRPKLRNNKFI